MKIYLKNIIQVVIYNTLSGEAEKILETKNKVNHLVKPVPNSNDI